MGSLFDWFGSGSSSNSSTQTKINKLEKEIETIKTTISNKVDKINGKDLSTNDFTNEYKDKVDGLVANSIEVIGGDEDTTEIINNVEVDVSLTKEGCAADAKVTGEKLEEIKKDLTQSESSILKSVKEYINSLNLTSEETPTIVTPIGDNTDYVTPQMFGAVGNGWTDDTEAIQKAIDSNLAVYFPRGEYVINNSLIIDNKKFWNLYAQDATIIYKGSDYAFRILNVMQSNIKIGYIIAENGGGIEFYSDSRESWNQYVVLDFNCIGAKTDCIHVETTDNGWCNENHVYGGRFLSGENGVNIVSRSHHTINGWKFYNCGIEGVTNGFMFDATEDEETAICNMAIVNCRYGESFETIFKTNGLVFDCMWLAPTHVDATIISCSPQTTRFEIIAPIGDYWRLSYDRAWHRGCIIDGKLTTEKIHYEEVK